MGRDEEERGEMEKRKQKRIEGKLKEERTKNRN